MAVSCSRRPPLPFQSRGGAPTGVHVRPAGRHNMGSWPTAPSLPHQEARRHHRRVTPPEQTHAVSAGQNGSGHPHCVAQQRAERLLRRPRIVPPSMSPHVRRAVPQNPREQTALRPHQPESLRVLPWELLAEPEVELEQPHRHRRAPVKVRLLDQAAPADPVVLLARLMRHNRIATSFALPGPWPLPP